MESLEVAAFTFVTTLFLLQRFPHVEGRSQPPSPQPPKRQYLLVNVPDVDGTISRLFSPNPLIPNNNYNFSDVMDPGLSTIKSFKALEQEDITDVVDPGPPEVLEQDHSACNATQVVKFMNKLLELFQE